jgi:hypothetical protein
MELVEEQQKRVCEIVWKLIILYTKKLLNYNKQRKGETRKNIITQKEKNAFSFNRNLIFIFRKMVLLAYYRYIIVLNWMIAAQKEEKLFFESKILLRIEWAASAFCKSSSHRGTFIRGLKKLMFCEWAIEEILEKMLLHSTPHYHVLHSKKSV